MRLFTLASTLLSLFIVKTSLANPQPVGFEVGHTFPNLVLPSLEDGQPMSLAQFRGQKLILQIFASW